MKLLSTNDESSRLELERQADASRERLAAAVDALDRRWRELRDVKRQLRLHAADLMSATSGLFLGTGASIAVALYRHRQRERRLRQERMRAITRLWRHPERVAVPTGFVGAALRMALVALAAMVTTTLVSHQVERMRKRPRLPLHPNEPLGV